MTLSDKIERKFLPCYLPDSVDGFQILKNVTLSKCEDVSMINSDAFISYNLATEKKNRFTLS
jgi:hypothetical protein